MHLQLADLIRQFRDAQDRAVEVVVTLLGPTLGVRLPSTNGEWIIISGESGLYNVRWINGIEVYSHGYGLELIIDGLTIDFDWGDAGEPDGFDTLRLWHFASINRLASGCDSFSQVNSWLEEAFTAGELTRDRLLYYSPAHRAIPLVTDPEWLTTTVVLLARQMDKSRDFSALPLLFDALQEAGCESDEVLKHCREPVEHVRGCWLVDLLLGKD